MTRLVGGVLAAAVGFVFAACSSGGSLRSGGSGTTTSSSSSGSSSAECINMGSCYGSVQCPVGSVCFENTFVCCAYSGSTGGTSSGSSSRTTHSSSRGTSTSGSSSGGSSSGSSSGFSNNSADCLNDKPNLETGETDQGGSCAGDAGCLNAGFSCVQDACAIEGADGPVEVVLNWDYDEDFDLHVVEPQQGGRDWEVGPNGVDGGPGCEIWYGNLGPGPTGGDCNPQGALYEDAEASCSLDGINIEEVHYPPNVPPPYGLYTVRVDFFEDCADTPLSDGGGLPNYPSIPYTLQIRVGSVVNTYCGAFSADQADYGGEGSGLTIATFTVGPPDAGCTGAGAGATGAACSNACTCASHTCSTGSHAVCYGGQGTGSFAACSVDDDCTSLSCQSGACCPPPDAGAPSGAYCLSNCDCASGSCTVPLCQ